MILGVNIQNFDVFADDTIGLMIGDSAQYAGTAPSERGIRLRNLNALIGRNNTGKSAFIRALSFVKRCILTDVGKASTTDDRPGFMNLLVDKERPASFRIFFRIMDPVTKKSDYLQYELTISASAQGSPLIENETLLASVKKEDGSIVVEEVFTNSSEARVVSDDRITALSVLGRLNGSDEPIKLLFNEINGWFFCAFSAEEASDYYAAGNAPGGHKHLNSEGSNIGNVLDYIKSLGDDTYNQLMEEINSKSDETGVWVYHTWVDGDPSSYPAQASIHLRGVIDAESLPFVRVDRDDDYFQYEKRANVNGVMLYELEKQEVTEHEAV